MSYTLKIDNLIAKSINIVECQKKDRIKDRVIKWKNKQVVYFCFIINSKILSLTSRVYSNKGLDTKFYVLDKVENLGDVYDRSLKINRLKKNVERISGNTSHDIFAYKNTFDGKCIELIYNK